MALCKKGLLVAAVLTVPASAILLQQSRSSCECLNWQEVYASGQATCGDGHEFFMATNSGMPRFLAKLAMGAEFCDHFFKRIDDNFCLNLLHGNEPGKWSSGQWCYVSPECTSAPRGNGSTALHVKLCTKGQDALLRTWAPEELSLWAKKNDFDVGLFVKMAYPVDKEAKWSVVNKAFGAEGSSAMAALSADTSTSMVASKLQSILASGRPVVLDSNDGHPPFAVVSGSTAYQIDLDLKHMDMKHPSTITTWKCFSGCPP